MKIKRILKEIIPYLLIIITVVLVRTFLYTTIRVNGESMAETLSNGELMILDKIGFNTKGLKRFDIIVFDTKVDRKLIKRVIGLPGETVEYKDDNLYINGKLLEDKYGYGYTFDFDLSDIDVDKIPNNYYFVMGDNRENSIDSRVLGLIKKDDIMGKAIFTVFPFKDFGSVNK
ncbi:MAG: signal peptidase I [Bacilli bacterium]|nr:signal peptidase I [Bacilli bacterium]